MKRKKPIVSYSADEVAKQRKHGKDLTDWQHVDQLTEADIDAAIADDADANTGPINWATVEIGSRTAQLDNLRQQLLAGSDSGPGLSTDDVFDRLEAKYQTAKMTPCKK